METKVIINKKAITRVASRAIKMSTTTISTMTKEEQTVNRGMHRTVKYLNEPFLVANLLIERSQSAVATTPRRTPKPLAISQ
jgi:hypothetical protein